MSASEKLRALGGTFEVGLRIGDTPPPTFELLFWDELVAVVEAAERLDPERFWLDLDVGRRTVDPALTVALAALDEALTPQASPVAEEGQE